jgi:hypothetical protein
MTRKGNKRLLFTLNQATIEWARLMNYSSLNLFVRDAIHAYIVQAQQAIQAGQPKEAQGA